MERNFVGLQQATQEMNKDSQIVFRKTDDIKDSPKGPGSINSAESPTRVNSIGKGRLEGISSINYQTEEHRDVEELNSECED